MKRQIRVDGVSIEVDDGDEYTSDITELDGEIAREEDEGREQRMIKELRRRGYTINDK